VRFALSEDQVDFRDAVASLLSDVCTPDAVREAWDTDGRVRPAWDALAEMGVLGLMVPESVGGLGMGDEDMVPLLIECGRRALPDPVGESAHAAAALLAAIGGAVADDWLGRIAAGSTVLPVIDTSAPVASASTADAFIFCTDGSGGVEIVLATADEVTIEALESVDGGRRPGRVERRGGSVLLSGPEAASLAATAADRLALASAAELVGLGEQMLDLTVDYVAERKQFGVAVGTFQAVKHQLADAALAVSFAAPLVLHAAYSLAHGLPEAPLHVSMAKMRASEAARQAASTSLQCHGAIGYTVEYDLHLSMKRAWALSYANGDPDAHRVRIRSALGLR
jgi:alkylation response protein AidB-like acyl-CoA dehydrogenase